MGPRPLPRPVTRPWSAWVVAVLVCAGCASQSAPPASGPAASAGGGAAPGGGAGVVQVTKQDITSVVVQAGTVSAYPGFVVALPAAGGTVSLSVKQGQHVAAGQQVGTVDGKALLSPAAGTVTQLGPGTGPVRLPANAPVVWLRYDGFGVTTTVSAENMYRVYGSPLDGKAALVSGASGIDCQVLPAAAGQTPGGGGGDVPAQGASPAGDGAAMMSTVCLLPLTVSAYQGQPAKVGIRFATVKDAAVLPVAAVSGSAQSGTVTRVGPDGRRTSVPVRLGATDGVVVQILSGVSPGDTVAAQAPDFVGP